jgi:hypothetical protein
MDWSLLDGGEEGTRTLTPYGHGLLGPCVYRFRHPEVQKRYRVVNEELELKIHNPPETPCPAVAVQIPAWGSTYDSHT